MEIIVIIIFVIIVWGVVSSIIEKCRQVIRDRVAHEVLDNSFDFEKEKAEILAIKKILAINRGLSFVKPENQCPSCSGVLVVRHGIYGPFLGCNNYPKCKYTRQIK